jgi:hypothetical protein
MTPEIFPMFAGGLFFLIWILIMLSGFIGFIMLIICSWRMMKAHESIAKSMDKYTMEKSVSGIAKENP